VTDLFNAKRSKEEGFQITPEHVERILTYILDDLETGKVLQHNTQAGQDSDAAVGLG
jgi:hypothetical protein